MDNKVKGSWLIHHTNKLQNVSNLGKFEKTFLAGKTGILLSAISESRDAVVNNTKLEVLAKAANINTITELPIIIGVLTGIARISSNPVLKNFAITYIELIRGTPLLVQIFIFYFFVGTILNLNRMTAGIVALAVFAGAYLAEIVRAGIQSISKGQMEAASITCSQCGALQSFGHNSWCT